LFGNNAIHLLKNCTTDGGNVMGQFAALHVLKSEVSLACSPLQISADRVELKSATRSCQWLSLALHTPGSQEWDEAVMVG